MWKLGCSRLCHRLDQWPIIIGRSSLNQKVGIAVKEKYILHDYAI